MSSLIGSLSVQFPVTSIREMKILKMLKHPNVLSLKEIVSSSGERWQKHYTVHALSSHQHGRVIPLSPAKGRQAAAAVLCV